MRALRSQAGLRTAQASRAESWNTPQVDRVEWNPAQVLGCVHGVAASCLAEKSWQGSPPTKQIIWAVPPAMNSLPAQRIFCPREPDQDHPKLSTAMP